MEELIKTLEEIKEQQMQYVQLARTTNIYKLADKAIKQALNIQNVSNCYTEKDMDSAYDKGFKDGNQRDLTDSLIEVL